MLKSNVLVNKEVATSFGLIKFNELGECAELTVEQQEHLGTTVPYIQYIPEAPVKEEEVKEEVEEKKAPAKKAPAKKAPAKKATPKAKKDEE